MNETIEVSFARAEEFVAPSISVSLLALHDARIEVRWASEFMDSVQHDVCCN